MSVATVILSVFLFVTGLFGSVVSVDQGTVHAVYKFGKVQEQLLSPGLNLVTPYITSTKPVDVSVKAVPKSFPSLTSDGQTINVTATVTYNVNAEHVPATARTIILTGNLDIDNKKISDVALEPLLLASVKQVVSQNTMSAIISNQEEISEKIIDEMNAKLSNQSIIDLKGLAITGIILDNEVQRAIEAKAIATQEQEAALIKAETAKITAQQNDTVSKSLTPSILQQQAIEKWDGHSLVFGSNTPVMLQAPNS